MTASNFWGEQRRSDHRFAKIVATLGPATANYDAIYDLADAGANVFRLNFSHGSHADHKATYEAIRQVEREIGHPLAVLLDLQGPKLRLGVIEEGVILQRDQLWRLDLDPAPGNAERACLPHPEIFEALKPGDKLLIDDGHLRLQVEECCDTNATVKVIIPGVVSSRKGVNVPDAKLSIPALTRKDRADLDFGLQELGVNWIALSFVQKAADIEELKAIVKGRAGVVAKLEKPSAIDDLGAVIEATDAVMVARGDLGVEVPLEKVPVLQKRIIRACRDLGKPVIVATQMLDSMIKSPVPTRAEASDVATAVYDGADAVMLSAESAVGAYPARSVSVMDNIIRAAEADSYQRSLLMNTRSVHQRTINDCITGSARHISETMDTAAIVTFTTSGNTTLRAARERPAAPIICLTSKASVAQKMSLVWGVRALEDDSLPDPEDLAQKALEATQSLDLYEEGQVVIVTAGLPFGKAGSTNMLQIINDKTGRAISDAKS